MRRTVVFAALSLLVAACFGVGIAQESGPKSAPKPPPAPPPSGDPTVPPNDCLAPPYLVPPATTSAPAWEVPADSLVTEQPDVNCFAWQQFIAMNWQGDPSHRGRPDIGIPPSEFGNPGSGPKAWETYKNTLEVFLEDAETPAPWNDPLDVGVLCGDLLMGATGPGEHIKLLALDAKFHNNLGEQQVLDEVNEAGVTPPAWLTAQSQRLVHYEVLINEDFFNYVVDPGNKFYDARSQGAVVEAGGPGISLPIGPSSYGPTGAIELKAGWLEIDPAQADRYLTSRAAIVDDDGSCRIATVGMVGLHIVHKTRTMPNWTWATFEHVDNAPDRIEVAKGELEPGYTFFDGDCPLGPVCQPELNPDGSDPRYDPACPLECAQNRKPEDGDPMGRPIQVVREVPIPGYVETLNRSVHQTIAAQNPASVFQHYRLVNTLWPQSGEEVEPGSVIPLNQGAAAPTTGLSNVTAETYAQRQTCLDCHQTATIACSSVTGADPLWASDYTFQLSRATEPDPPVYCGGGDDD